MAKKDKEEIVDFGADVEETDAVVSDSGEIELELTEAEKRKLEAEAKKEVAAAIKASKMKDFKAAAKKRLQSEAMFAAGKDDTGEDLGEIDLVLASYPKYIILDGKMYFSGRKYKKKKSVIAVLKDQMDRGWRQEAARIGEKLENLSPVRYNPGAGGLRYAN